MQIFHAILAGIAGTAIMTLYMYAMSFLTERVMKVVQIVGTMLTMKTTPEGKLSNSKTAIVVGVIAHYAVGVIFALCYYYLWMHGIGSPGFTSFLLFGLVNGVIAIVVWRVFFLLHPQPPAISIKPYLFHLFLAHFIFTAGVFITYQILQKIASSHIHKTISIISSLF